MLRHRWPLGCGFPPIRALLGDIPVAQSALAVGTSLNRDLLGDIQVAQPGPGQSDSTRARATSGPLRDPRLHIPYGPRALAISDPSMVARLLAGTDLYKEVVLNRMAH